MDRADKIGVMKTLARCERFRQSLDQDESRLNTSTTKHNDLERIICNDFAARLSKHRVRAECL